MAGHPGHRLPGDVAREVRETAHLGKGDMVLEILDQVTEAFANEAYEDTLDPLERAKGFAPRSATVRELYGLAFYHLGRFREAVRELAAYRRMSGRHDQDHVSADAERALGRPEKALDLLDRTPTDELSDDVRTEAAIVRAGALLDLGRPDEAVAALEPEAVRPAEVQPHHLRLWYALADALERVGRRRDARGWWDVLYAEDPEFFDVAQRRFGVKPR